MLNKASWHKSCRDRFNNTKLERLKKRKVFEIEDVEMQNDDCSQEVLLCSSPVKARRSSQAAFNPHYRCFFCESQDEPQNLHSASTIEIDKNVRESAILLNDRKIIAKLVAGDLIAIEAKYHAKCLVAFYNRARPLKQKSTISVGDDKDSIDVKELAFAELLSYIEDRLENEKPAILTLSDLVSFYTFNLKELGADFGTVHATRLKERVLSACSDLSAHAEGRDVRLALRSEIGGILSDVKQKDTDAWCLAKAANLVRKEISKVKNSFNGSFSPECQKSSLPPSLLTLLGMILKGSLTKTDPSDSQACLSIAQLIVLNSISRTHDRPEPSGSTRHRHIREKECPLPIFTALKIHGTTRDRSLVDAFYKLGLCISYDRFLTLSTEIANSVIERYEREDVVCPAKLRSDVFCTAAVDNIDHNTSSITPKGSFHGTAISIVSKVMTQMLLC